MSRNRKSQAGSAWILPSLKATLLCLFFGGAAVGYVWQQRKLHDLDAMQRSLEARLDLLRRDNRIISGQLADLQLPSRLQDRAQKLAPPLARAVPSQIVRLPEPAPSPSRLYSDLLAAEKSREASMPPHLD